jgi:glycine hydroxymethyltransferase
MITSGIRIGSPAMTTKGFKEEEFIKIGRIISSLIKNEKDVKTLKKEVLLLTK